MKAFVLDALHDQAFQLFAPWLQRYAPSRLGVAVASPPWKTVRRRQIRRDTAEAALADRDAMSLPSIACVRLRSTAFGLAVGFDHPIDDCCYVALAKELPATLVIADGGVRHRLETSRRGLDRLDFAEAAAQLG